MFILSILISYLIYNSSSFIVFITVAYPLFLRNFKNFNLMTLSSTVTPA